MSDKLTLLFPSDYFDRNRVDDDLRVEYDAAIATGLYDIILFSYEDWFNNGFITLNKSPDAQTKVIYRGWMMTPEKYESFGSALILEKIWLKTHAAYYEKMHAFPNIYPELEDDTPRILTFPAGEKVDVEVINRTFDRFKIKDYVKSVKGSQFPEYFFKGITQKELDGYLEEFRKFRGDLFTGGICIKEYVDLKYYGDETNEFRVFYANNNVVSVCRNSLQDPFTLEPPKELIEKYRYLNSPFYTVDYAERADGGWIIIETGDGQVSGLSYGQDAEAFYRSLYHAFTTDMRGFGCEKEGLL